MDFEKIYRECEEKRVLKEERLQEMGLIPVQRAANSLRKTIQNLIESYSGKNTSLENNDIITKRAVENLLDKGSGTSAKDEFYTRDFDPKFGAVHNYFRRQE